MFCKKLYPYRVKLHLCGRHPYLENTKYDFETQDIWVTVTARNWKHAEDVAIHLPNLPQSWSRRVVAIERA